MELSGRHYTNAPAEWSPLKRYSMPFKMPLTHKGPIDKYSPSYSGYAPYGAFRALEHRLIVGHIESREPQGYLPSV